MNTEKKLRPEEVSLYRKTFLARVSNGATVEAADRAAIHACTLWERRGAFNEEPGDDGQNADEKRFADGFAAIVEHMGNDDIPPVEFCAELLKRYRDREIDISTLRARLGLII